jgi:ABC-type antimicrobial peptide transport system permease subunit
MKKIVKLKRIGVLSLAKLQAILLAFMGLIIGIPYAIIGTFFLGEGLFTFGIFVIIFPILYAIFGFIGGAIMAFLYNLVAGWVGGIEMDFK